MKLIAVSLICVFYCFGVMSRDITCSINDEKLQLDVSLVLSDSMDQEVQKESSVSFTLKDRVNHNSDVVKALSSFKFEGAALAAGSFVGMEVLSITAKKRPKKTIADKIIDDDISVSVSIKAERSDATNVFVGTYTLEQTKVSGDETEWNGETDDISQTGSVLCQ